MASHGLFALSQPPEGRRREGPSPEDLRKFDEDERKRSFLRMVSHELRTPLNAIIGFSEIISCELYGPVNDVRYRDHAAMVRDSGLKLLRLVNQIMEIARLEAGAADLDIHAEPARPAIDEAIAGLGAEAAARNVQIAVEEAPDLPLVMADTRALRTVVSNLLQNALTFTPQGGTVTVSLTAAARSICIAVRDEGEGVGEDHLARLMRPFEQGEAALTRRSEGAGLGLPIARLLCKAMSGALRLRSAPGAGFTAIVRLPLVKPAGQSRTDHAA